MKRIEYCALVVFLVSCGKLATTKQEKKNQPTVDNTTVTEYKWYKPIRQYIGKKVEGYGFLWMDTITSSLPAGLYKIYERPNCYQCGVLEFKAETNIQSVLVDDTTIVNTHKGAQWRLVKILGTVNDLAQLNIERFELSEYVYPDYINSGYIKISDEFYSNPPSTGQPTYIDGYLKFNGIRSSTMEVAFKISGNKLSKELTILIKEGRFPNQVNPIPMGFKPNQIIIKDHNNQPVKTQQLRIYGIWNAKETDGNDVGSGGNLHVEMIETIQ